MNEKSRALVLLATFLILTLGLFVFFPDSKGATITSFLNYSSINNIPLQEINFGENNSNFVLEPGKSIRIYDGDESGGIFAYVQKTGNEEVLKILSNFGKEETVVLGDTKKIDLNSDGFYEISISYGGFDNISLSQIHEPVSFIANIEDKINSPILPSSEVSFSYALFWVLFLLFILLFFYIYKLYVWPYLRIKKIKGKQTNLEILEFLIKEFKESVRKGNKKNAKLNYDRINHLVSYLNPDERMAIKDKLREVEKNYIVDSTK